MKKTKFLLLSISALTMVAISTSASIGATHKSVKAEGEQESVTTSLKSCVQGFLHTGEEITSLTGAFNLYHGNLSYATPSILAYDSVNTSEQTASTTSGDANVLYNGDHYEARSLNNDRVIFAFRSFYECDLTLDAVGYEGEGVYGWLDNSELKYWTAAPDFKFTPNDPSKNTGKLTCTDTFSLTDNYDTDNLEKSIRVLAGETIFIEWGFPWGGDHRNMNINHVGLRVTQKFPVAAEDTDLYTESLNLEQLYTDVSWWGGETRESAIDYGCYFGSIEGGPAASLAYNGGNITTTNAGGDWWNFTVAKDEYAVFYIKANAYIEVQNIVEQVTGWNDGTVNLDYVIERNETAIFSKTYTNPTSTNYFNNKVNLMPGDVLYVQISTNWDATRTVNFASYSNFAFTVKGVKLSPVAIEIIAEAMDARAYLNLCTLEGNDQKMFETALDMLETAPSGDLEAIQRTYDTDGYTVYETIVYFANYYAGASSSSKLVASSSANVTLIIAIASLNMLAVAYVFVRKTKHSK